MEIVTQMQSSAISCQTYAVALGTFDGIHLGHQAVIAHAVERARATNAKSAVFTFSNHPLTIIDPKKCPPLISTYEDKVRLIAAMGVDVLYMVPFDQDLLHLSPQDFICELLKIFTPGCIVVGPNYTFGYCGKGTPLLLQQVGKERGFTVEVQPAIAIEGQLVSSTRIRNSVAAGDMLIANKLLGRPFRLTGTVVPGDQRGRKLAAPTANLQVDVHQVLPMDGVYVVYAILGSQRLPALANIGTNPTFMVSERRIEVFILDFAGDIYGQTLAVDFLCYLRAEITFPDASQLQEQIVSDIAAARKIFCSK